MLRVLPFAAADFSSLERRPFTDLELAAQSQDARSLGELYERGGPSFTFWREDGMGKRPILCGGAVESHPGHATVWAALSRDASADILWITKRVRAFVNSLSHRRLDAFVAAANPGAIGWAKLCGFSEEARLQSYYPDGGECVVMVNLRED
tara:strand:- start:328 stop:780 length:453 start_codon:yes stop_codon:yes gene_type:complete